MVFHDQNQQKQQEADLVGQISEPLSALLVYDQNQRANRYTHLLRLTVLNALHKRIPQPLQGEEQDAAAFHLFLQRVEAQIDRHQKQLGQYSPQITIRAVAEQVRSGVDNLMDVVNGILKEEENISNETVLQAMQDVANALRDLLQNLQLSLLDDSHIGDLWVRSGGMEFHQSLNSSDFVLLPKQPKPAIIFREMKNDEKFLDVVVQEFSRQHACVSPSVLQGEVESRPIHEELHMTKLMLIPFSEFRKTCDDLKIEEKLFAIRMEQAKERMQRLEADYRKKWGPRPESETAMRMGQAEKTAAEEARSNIHEYLTNIENDIKRHPIFLRGICAPDPRQDREFLSLRLELQKKATYQPYPFLDESKLNTKEIEYMLCLSEAMLHEECVKDVLEKLVEHVKKITTSYFQNADKHDLISIVHGLCRQVLGRLQELMAEMPWPIQNYDEHTRVVGMFLQEILRVLDSAMNLGCTAEEERHLKSVLRFGFLREMARLYLEEMATHAPLRPPSTTTAEGHPILGVVITGYFPENIKNNPQQKQSSQCVDADFLSHEFLSLWWNYVWETFLKGNHIENLSTEENPSNGDILRFGCADAEKKIRSRFSDIEKKKTLQNPEHFDVFIEEMKSDLAALPATISVGKEEATVPQGEWREYFVRRIDELADHLRPIIQESHGKHKEHMATLRKKLIAGLLRID